MANEKEISKAVSEDEESAVSDALEDGHGEADGSTDNFAGQTMVFTMLNKVESLWFWYTLGNKHFAAWTDGHQALLRRSCDRGSHVCGISTQCHLCHLRRWLRHGSPHAK